MFDVLSCLICVHALQKLCCTGKFHHLRRIMSGLNLLTLNVRGLNSGKKTEVPAIFKGEKCGYRHG